MAKARRASRTGKPAKSKRTPQAPSRTTQVATGVVGLLTRTAVTTVSGVRDVGAEIGSVAVTAVRGSVRAAGEIGADVGRLAAGAAEGAIDAADRIAVAAGKAVGNIVSGTVEGFREIMQSPAPRRPTALKSRQQLRGTAASRLESPPSARRKPLARRPARSAERAQPNSGRTAGSS
jgi:hypothetical protein